MNRGFLVSCLRNTLREEAISRLWTEEMQTRCYRLYKDAFCRALKCTLTIGQPTIAWLGCLTLAHMKSLSMPTVS